MKKNKIKALFVHISKTGGTSIGKAPFIITHGTPQISPTIPLKDLGLKFSFSFVRNPYERFTSAVFNHGYCKPEEFEKWVTGEFLENYEEKFKGWEEGRCEWQELIPQFNYLVHAGKIDVDFIGKLENIKEDWKKVCEMAGEDFKLEHLNKNKYTDHAKYHTEVTKAVVRRVYKKDFELLEYAK